MAHARPRHAVAYLLVLALALSVLAVTDGPASAQAPEFSDLDSTLHAEAIQLVAEDGITQGWPDGTFRPREDVRRDQMATFLTNALDLDASAPTFPDVPAENVHHDAIGALQGSGITGGFTDGTYRPRNFVTRGQMATFLATGLDLPAGNATFRDVPGDYVHADAIAALADAGITSGFPDGTFRPNSLVKRDQMAAFLAAGIPLPRPGDPCAPNTSTRSATDAAPSAQAQTTDEAPTTDEDAEDTSADLRELELGDRLETLVDGAISSSSAVAPTQQDVGPAIPDQDFLITSALSTSSGLEAFSHDQPSKGVRLDTAGDVTRVIDIPTGTRTWASARLGDHVYVGQWGPQHGQTNLYRYPVGGSGGQVQQVAAVPSGNEFWTLAAQGNNRLWAGTRAHANSSFRDQIGLGSNWTRDPRHVIHRIEPANNRVTNVIFGTPYVPEGHTSTRPDIKQLATLGSTVYVGTGQQAGSTRLYAFEPGNRTQVPADDVRDITPPSICGATSVFSLEVNDRWIALGTQAASGQDARLVVLDRTSEEVRVDVALPSNETRIDDVALRGNRVVGTGLTGSLYDVPIPTSGTRTTVASTYDPPVGDQFSRYVEIASNNALRGVTNRGLVWTRATTGEVEINVLGDSPSLDAVPGLPHSLHAGSEDVAIGGSGVVALHEDGAVRLAAVSGEAKALTSDADGNTFAASYPNAQLWRIPAGGDEAVQVGGWTREFTRPADTAYDATNNRVLVVAREEANSQSESRTAPWRNFGFRPSHLFDFAASGESTSRTGGTPLTRPSGGSQVPVEARTVTTGPDGEVYVGDTRGGVQRLNRQANGTYQRAWYRDAAEAERFHDVVGIDVVDGSLVTVISGVPARTDETVVARTVIRELNPANGNVRSNTTDVVSTEWAIPDAVTTGSVTIMPSRSVIRQWNRATDTYTQQPHPTNFSFGGPYASLNEECELYTFRGVSGFSHLARSEITTGCVPGSPLLPGLP